MTAIDPKATTKSVQCLDLQVVASDDTVISETDGTVIDTKGFEYCSFYLAIGTIGTSGVVTAKVQSGSSNTGLTDVTGASFGTISQTGTDQSDLTFVGQVRCFENDRYLGVSVGVTGGSATVEAYCVAVLHGAKDTTQYLTSGEFVFDV